MRTRLLLLAAGLALLVLGGVIGAVVFADDNPEPSAQSIRPSLPAPDRAAVEAAGDADRPLLAGVLHDGRAWTLRFDRKLGICQTIGGTDFGCEVPNTVLSDRAMPRRVVEGTRFSDPQSAILMYAYLPTDATHAELVRADGTALATREVVEQATQIWAAPVTPGDNPAAVIYRDDNGVEVARFPSG
jgi:hypothetical protein